MTKDDKINLKLEVYKDKNSGKLSLIAHFDKTAPNIYKDKENFYWEPTLEEKEFLFEAFKIMPDVPVTPPTKDSDSKSEVTSKPDNAPKQENSEELEEQYEEKTPTEDTTPTEQPTDEKPEKSSTFSATKDTDTEESTNIEKDDTQPNIDDVVLEEIDDDEVKTLENEEDKAMIVEADSDAIDEAIKKHTKDDDSIVEADEQTIIDKVLSQKKKGRWGKK